MKRVCAVLGILLVAVLAPRPASADSILDPIIGVRGGSFGSLDPSDPSFNSFGSCDGLAADLASEGFECLVYRINSAFDLAENGLTSLVLQIQDLAGNNASNFVADNPFCESSSCRPGSEFNVTDLLHDGLVQLSAFEGQPLTCSDGDYSALCVDALVYIKPGPNENQSLQFQAGVREVNGNPVPEPGTLVLMGTGVATLAARTRRRRSSRAA